VPLHLLKLCVGIGSIAELEASIAERLATRRAAKRPVEQIHTTRMVPKRIDELLDGGSLYWVIRGQIAARQALQAVRPFTDADGISRCDLVLEPVVVPVALKPCRPFQGWRYLTHEARPVDLADLGETTHMPDHLRFALRELGLI
jgi:hypothetical protein